MTTNSFGATPVIVRQFDQKCRVDGKSVGAKGEKMRLGSLLVSASPTWPTQDSERVLRLWGLAGTAECGANGWIKPSILRHVAWTLDPRIVDQLESLWRLAPPGVPVRVLTEPLARALVDAVGPADASARAA